MKMDASMKTLLPLLLSANSTQTAQNNVAPQFVGFGATNAAPASNSGLTGTDGLKLLMGALIQVLAEKLSKEKEDKAVDAADDTTTDTVQEQPEQSSTEAAADATPEARVTELFGQVDKMDLKTENPLDALHEALDIAKDNPELRDQIYAKNREVLVDVMQTKQDVWKQQLAEAEPGSMKAERANTMIQSIQARVDMLNVTPEADEIDSQAEKDAEQVFQEMGLYGGATDTDAMNLLEVSAIANDHPEEFANNKAYNLRLNYDLLSSALLLKAHEINGETLSRSKQQIVDAIPTIQAKIDALKADAS